MSQRDAADTRRLVSHNASLRVRFGRQPRTMDWLELPERRVEITIAPVDRASYLRFARETGRPVPPRSGSPTSPVTQVSAEEACVFAAWLSQRDSYDYRLPTLDDLLALADLEPDVGTAGNRPVYLHKNGATDDRRPLSEWLQCVPDHRDGRSGLRCVANPSWLRSNGGPSMRGALSEGRYSFVTFRLVRIKTK